MFRAVTAKLARASLKESTKRLPYLLVSLLPLGLIQGANAAGPERIPVRTVVAETSKFTREISLSGAIQARVQTSLSFRISGKMKSRTAEVGAHVNADQVLATLDPRDQVSDLESAKAALSSAEAMLVQTKAAFGRQKALLAKGFTPRAIYDQAKTSFDVAIARVDSAKASLKSAEEQLSYTDLRAGAAGIIVGRQAEVGEVVQPGTPIFTLAEDGPRDAVFEVYEALLGKGPEAAHVEVMLQANPNVRTTANVREVSPTVDAKSGTVRVKLGLTTTPPEMTLGAAVVGKAWLECDESIALPWSALYDWRGTPAVWLVGEDNRVSPQTIAIGSFATKELVVSGGIKPGDKVVTAGIQFLRPGQEVTDKNGGSQ
jgi:RND family efflux transporter MFP subunit